MRIHFRDRVGSTSDEAFALADAGEPLPLAVRACEQNAGRGRLGRSWSSPRGGVWMSIAGPAGDAHLSGALALRAALAVREAIAPALRDDERRRLTIRWPNDLLLDGMKVAGVLCERRTLARGEEALIIGIGINADFDASQLPADVRTPATTLRTALGRPADPDISADPFAGPIADRLAESIPGVIARAGYPLTASELAAILGCLDGLDEPARLTRPDGTAVGGTLAGLTPEGLAVVRTRDQAGERIERIASAE